MTTVSGWIKVVFSPWGNSLHYERALLWPLKPLVSKNQWLPLQPSFLLRNFTLPNWQRSNCCKKCMCFHKLILPWKEVDRTLQHLESIVFPESHSPISCAWFGQRGRGYPSSAHRQTIILASLLLYNYTSCIKAIFHSKVPRLGGNK